MLIVGLIVLAMMAIALIVFLDWAKDKFDEGITVSADGVTESILSVRDLKLNPTESKEYSINLVCEATGSYHIDLDYLEKFDGGMKNFVNVTVVCEGATVYEGSLVDLLDNQEVISFEGELHADEPLVVTVIYDMPYEVGNEAQGTYSDFDILLTITKS